MSNAVGRPTPLIDGRAKVTGTIRYTPDVTIPGMLYARFVTSLHAHANLRGIDTRAALAVPGVSAVVTARDLPDIPPSERGKLLLARDRVMFMGQPVAIVLATSEAAAEDGVGQVAVDYDPLPAAMTMDDALADGAPLVWPKGVPTVHGESANAHGTDSGESIADQSKPSNLAGEYAHRRGNVTRGFAEAEVVVEHTYTMSMVHQSPIETQSVVVEPDLATGGATVWSNTQTQFGTRESVAAVLRVPDSDVRVIGMPVGGAFGSKFVLYEPLIAAVARQVGRPVRLVLTRSEEMLAANPTPPIRFQLKIGAKRDGDSAVLTALQAQITVDDGCYPFGLSGFLGHILASIYRLPHFDIHTRDVLTFKPSVGAYRAPGGAPMFFALDTVMDELAEKLHLDPLAFRLRNIAVSGDPMADDKLWPRIGSIEVLQALRDHPAWQNREQSRAAGRGVGVAIAGWLIGAAAASAFCALQRDGLLHVHVGSVDLNGTTTGFALMAADAFGVSPDKIRIVTDDTQSAAFAPGTGGSTITYNMGAAVIRAVRDARQQVLAVAAEEFEAAPEDLEIVDGSVRVRGVPTKTIPLGKIADRANNKYAPIFAQGRLAEGEGAPSFCAQLAEVEVDRETGVVKVLRLVVVQDVGKAINPLAIRGQMMGGATQGLGWALYEQMAYDEQGQLQTGSLRNYALPHSEQAAGKIETIIVEVPSDSGPLGVRGVGEPSIIPTAAAVANAIAHATGARMTDLPMTAPRVLRALKG